MLLPSLKVSDPVFLEHMHRVLYGEHWDPHSLLGIHPFFHDHQIIRVFRPGAQQLCIEVAGVIHPMRRIHDEGMFDLIVSRQIEKHQYRVFLREGQLIHDPYSFSPTWGEWDSYLLNQGTHYELHKKMGARFSLVDGIEGVAFIVWAPNAKRVSVVGDFNHWDGRIHPLRSMGRSGVWELFIPGLGVGERYKFEILTQQGTLLLKSDPYATGSEHRPHTASVLSSITTHSWQDQSWMASRNPKTGPLNMYEVHLGSWQDQSERYSYQDVAVDLVTYCKKMGYTHIELLPIMEHPLDESWGYQVTGYLCPTSRYGSCTDLQAAIDYIHQHGIGVILDWVPAHFPKDSFGLALFDGTALYEHADPRQGYHPHWHTSIFNYGRPEVSNFLLASALFWLEVMHIDGLRVDAVASMLYLDYGRNEGEWIPNAYGGKENLHAIEFLKHLNSIVHQRCPGVLMIAEESTSFPGVTQPVEWGGLGFDYKWNMGWMNDTLRYFGKDPFFRRYHHQDLTFGLLYAFSEQFILPFSHDEVVHGKHHLLSKMTGDYWQRFANLRLLLSYQICQPGKKLLFMGAEFGMWEEWDVKSPLPWFLLSYESHRQLQLCVRDLNHLYLEEEALWQFDHDSIGFQWIDFSDESNSVISYLRKGKGDYQLLCIHNFTPCYHEGYFLPLSCTVDRELFSSDHMQYGGSGKVQLPVLQESTGLKLSLPPLATLIYAIRVKDH